MKGLKQIPDNVRDMFDYDPNTGILTWEHRPDMPNCWNGRYAGTEAGLVGGKLITVGINGRRYGAHRVIFKWMGFDLPDWARVDHRNGDALDNRWSNLRLATHGDNCRNSKSRGAWPKGVSFKESNQKFQAQIIYKGKNIYLGYFTTSEAAAEAYKKAAERLCPDFMCVDR